ncbi:MAG TPA: xanthine dehydrogenase family protein subunit M [Bacteroidetes bacterium]|nr:xanthine dehydrogenase family protein subunit M [Bacteroidota bacterium]
MTKIESFHQPQNLQEALTLLAFLVNPKVIAGGTDLMAQMHRDEHIERLRKRPAKPWMLQPLQIVDVSRIAELHFISVRDCTVSLGPLLKHDEIVNNETLREKIPFLGEASGKVGSQQIRNVGTVGGNICNGSPCADTVPPLLCLRAEITLQSVKGERKMALQSFFTGAQETLLCKDELLTKIEFRVPEGETAQFFYKLGQRKGAAIAKLNVAFLAVKEKKRLRDVRIALGAVGATPIVAEKTARFLSGRQISESIIAEAKSICSNEAQPITDIRSTREYRRAMTGELLAMGLQSFLS